MKLFISYAHTDKWQVKQLVEILEDAGHQPWFDNKLLPGQDWKQALADAIVDCESFVYAMTPESITSEWCQWEFTKAVELGKPVIPILVQPKTKVPDNIRRYQYADFSEGPTPKNVAKLMGGISQIAINIPKAEAPTAPENPDGIPSRAE
jgi:hypothetical protein